MRTICLAILLTPSLAVAQPASLAPQNRTVDMDADAKRHNETVRGAPLQLTALVFPGRIEEARCGNCTDKQGDVVENWSMTVSKQQGRIYLKPTRYPDAAHPVASFRTTLFVILDSGYSITVDIQLAALNGGQPPDAEVVFSLPDSATLSGRLAEERAKQEAQYAERLERESMQRFLSALLGELDCEDLVDVPYQEERLYVRVFQACHADTSPATYWVVFEIENRHSSPVAIRRAVLADSGDSETLEDDPKRAFRLERRTLRFDQRTRGIALTKLAPGQSPPSGWTLQVEEDGGSGRIVAVDDLDF
ncbi:MAG: hypothetical protein AAFQ77_03145 [Myxococcota bacterium]